MTCQLTTSQACSASVGTTISSGPSSSSCISVATAYLYSCFAQGNLSGYNYTTGTGRETCADEVQDAIWYFQGEINSSDVSDTQCSLYKFNENNPYSDPYIALCEKLFGKDCTESDLSYGNTFGVCSLNLTCTNGCQTVYCQDQLVYTPVPEPATFAAGAMLLLPLGVGAVRALRNKSK
jgi:hypothetical protein